MGEFVRLEAEDGVGTIRLDRPPVNALNEQVAGELLAAAREVSERPDVRAVILYGGEKLFAAGADITEMADRSYTEMATGGELQAAFTAVASIPQPVAAAVTGYALGGGCEFALCADYRVCAEDARLGQPEIQLGIIPGAGGTQRLPRLVGPSKAKDLVFTGRLVAAAEAEGMGLVDRVVASGEAYGAAAEWARQFVGGPAQALRAAKQALDRGLEVDLDTGLEIERLHFSALFATEDQRIGMRSFLDNGPGKARFTGR